MSNENRKSDLLENSNKMESSIYRHILFMNVATADLHLISEKIRRRGLLKGNQIAAAQPYGLHP